MKLEAIKKQIISAIHANEWNIVGAEINKESVPTIVHIITEVEKPYKFILFRLLTRDKAIEVFSNLSTPDQEELLGQLSTVETRQLLAELKPDNRTELFEEMPGEVTRRLIGLLSSEDLKETRHLLGYPEDSAGRLMTPDYVTVHTSASLSEVLDVIRANAEKSETINDVYVVDDQLKLVGVASLRDIILTPPSKKMKDIMITDVVSVKAEEDREVVARIMQDHDLNILPVVDSRNILLGIVTVDDVLDVVQEEVTEDFHKSSAVAPLEGSYSTTSIYQLLRKRVFWLLILVVVNLVSSGVIAAFEETIATYIALAFFIPLLIDSGGNAGSQSATLMIRSIATDDVRISHWFSIFIKEIGVGLGLGVLMGVASAVLGIFRGGYEIGLVVGISMISIVLMANLIGVSLPFVLTRFKIDPAVASGPLITTAADAVGLLIYFSVARIVLGI